MTKVRIIIDSASDMTPEEAQALGLVFLPLTTWFGDREYLDGVTLRHEEFYAMLESSKEVPTTSQLTPYAYRQAYDQALREGAEVLVITLSGKLSGTAQSARLAAEECPGKVWVVDSENVTAGERILIDYAVRLRDQGLPAGEIARELEAVKKRICLVAVVDTLEYLMRGGRLSRTAAVAGTVLNIKPVIGIEDGQVVVLGKARGARRSSNLLTETIGKKGGIDFSMPFMLVYSGTDDTLLREYIEHSRDLWQAHVQELPISTIGSTIGTHAGPGAVGVAFFAAHAGPGEAPSPER